jgi:hypothetical protein
VQFLETSTLLGLGHLRSSSSCDVPGSICAILGRSEEDHAPFFFVAFGFTIVASP